MAILTSPDGISPGDCFRVRKGMELKEYDTKCDGFNVGADHNMEHPGFVGVVELVTKKDKDVDTGAVEEHTLLRVVGFGPCGRPRMALTDVFYLQEISYLETIAAATALPWPGSDILGDISCKAPGCKIPSVPDGKLCAQCHAALMDDWSHNRHGSRHAALRRSMAKEVEGVLRGPWAGVGKIACLKIIQQDNTCLGIASEFHPKGKNPQPEINIVSLRDETYADYLEGKHSSIDLCVEGILIEKAAIKPLLTAISHVAPELLDEVVEEMRNLD